MKYFLGLPLASLKHLGHVIALVLMCSGMDADATENTPQSGGAETEQSDRGHGAATATESSETMVVLMVAEASQESDFRPLMPAVRAQLSDFPVVFKVKWVDDFPGELPAQEELSVEISRDTGASMVFWCDFTQSDKTYLYLAIPALSRVVVRRLDGSGIGFTAETLGIIVRNLVDAVIKGAVDSLEPHISDGTPQDDKLDSAAETNETAGSEVTVRGENGGEPQRQPAQTSGLDAPQWRQWGANLLYVQVGYALDVLSTSHPATHGVSFFVDLSLPRDWHIFVGYVIAIPMTSEVNGVEMELRRHPALVGTRYGWKHGRWEVGAGLALSLDYVGEKLESARGSTGSVDIRTEGGELLVSLLPFFQTSFRVFSSWHLFLDAGCDLPFRRPNYVVESEIDGRRTSVFLTWIVRPIGRFGVMVGFL